MKVDLVGPIPPPFGGVSVHLQRLMSRLLSDGHHVEAHSPQGSDEHLLRAYWRMARRCRGDVIHFHLHGLLDKYFMGFLGTIGRPVALTIHGQNLEDQVRTLSSSRRRLLGASMRRLSAFIGVNERIRDFAVNELGVPSEKAYTIPAFLPPDAQALQAEQPADEIGSFLKDHQPVLSANAFNLSMYEGVPLYGSDLLVDLLSAIREEIPDAGLVFFVSIVPESHQEALDALREHIRNKGLDDHFKVVLGSHPFGSTLVRSNLLVRPTATDGDAVTIREALSLGIPVIASDVVSRPDGTRVVPHRDLSALVGKTLTTLSENRDPNANPIQIPQRDIYPEIMKVYENVCS